MRVFHFDVSFYNILSGFLYFYYFFFLFAITDDDNAFVHGILTSDNLFDGTITTNLEQYYIEPSNKYSNDLHKTGVHSIVYKISDVEMHQMPHHHSHLLTTPPSNIPTTNGNNNHVNDAAAAIDVNDLKNANADDDDSVLDSSIKNIDNNNFVVRSATVAESKHCASEILRKKYKNEYKKRRKYDDKITDDINNYVNDGGIKLQKRNKRWLPDEVCYIIYNILLNS